MNSQHPRTESVSPVDSFPDVGFVVQEIVEEEEEEVALLNQPSEFKIMEANGTLLPEPLLIEDKSRFVLFPIKHADVRYIDSLFSQSHLPHFSNIRIDMGYVQESRSFFLDCRRSRFASGP